MLSIFSQSKPIWVKNLVFNIRKLRQRKRHPNLWKTNTVVSEWRWKTFWSQFTVRSQKSDSQFFFNRSPCVLKILCLLFTSSIWEKGTNICKKQPSSVRVELENLLFTFYCSQPKIMPSICSQSKPVCVENFVFNVHKFRQRKRDPNLWKTNQVVSESSWRTFCSQFTVGSQKSCP